MSVLPAELEGRADVAIEDGNGQGVVGEVDPPALVRLDPRPSALDAAEVIQGDFE